jgi:hypothetical protein
MNIAEVIFEVGNPNYIGEASNAGPGGRRPLVGEFCWPA